MIKSGKVKAIIAMSVFSFAPSNDDNNHSLNRPVILPNKINELNINVDFFIDN